MSIESRIRQLETTMEPAATHEPLVILYPAGKQPPTTQNDGRIRIFIPDNGRAPNRATNVDSESN
jgi:hypothetical protein